MSSFLFNLNNGRESLFHPHVVSGRSSYHTPLVIIQVQTSPESSSQCLEHSVRLNSETPGATVCLLWENLHFQVVFVNQP